MLKSIDDKNNVIYGDLSLQKNLKLEFKGSNNIVFLLIQAMILILLLMGAIHYFFIQAEDI